MCAASAPEKTPVIIGGFAAGALPMEVKFRAVQYKSMAGYYIETTLPGGQSEQINVHASSLPAFRTGIGAPAWIANESADWKAQRIGQTRRDTKLRTSQCLQMKN